MTPDQLEAIGKLADKADNFWHAAQLPVSHVIHAKSLTEGMKEIRDELRALYVACGGSGEDWVGR